MLTQSVGLLSYTFLRQLDYDRIVLPAVSLAFFTCFRFMCFANLFTVCKSLCLFNRGPTSWVWYFSFIRINVRVMVVSKRLGWIDQGISGDAWILLVEVLFVPLVIVLCQHFAALLVAFSCSSPSQLLLNRFGKPSKFCPPFPHSLLRLPIFP